MDGDAGAINKVGTAITDFLSGNFSGAGTELSAAANDLVVSTEKLLGRVTTDGEKLFIIGLATLKNDLATPLGQAVVQAVGTAIGAAASGQSVTQIGQAVLPTLETAVVTDAKAAGTDVENTVLDAARVMLLGQSATTTAAGNAAASPEAQQDSSDQSS
jgi:hypothetical protein